MVSYLVLYKSLISRVLTALSTNIPLSFFNSSLDPVLGIVDMLAIFIKSGICPSVLILLNKINKDSLKLSPMHSMWKILQFIPWGSLDLFLFISFNTTSNSLIVQSGLLFFFASFNLASKDLFLISFKCDRLG